MTGAGWTRRTFGSVGLTQYRPGPYLRSVQDHYVGKVVLCLDVSLSMEGAPLAAAQRGALAFVSEARAAGYRVGVVLWARSVVASVSVDEPPERVDEVIAAAAPAFGTDLAPALEHVIGELGRRSADRVVCVFGDGDVGDRLRCIALARQARRKGIRFVVRGLGAGAAGHLGEVLTPGEDGRDQIVRSGTDLSTAIASMSRSLRPGREVR